MRFSIESRLAAAFLTAFLLVLLAGGYAFHRSSLVAERSAGGEATHSSLEELNELLLAVHEAESGVRNWVLTGREEDLGPFLQAGKRIGRILDAMKGLHAGDEVKLVKIRAFERLVSSRMDSLARVVELRRSRGLAAARAAVSSGENDPRQRVLGDAVRRMQAEDLSALLERAERDRRDGQHTVWAVFVSGVLALALLALSGLRARRDFLLRGEAERRARDAALDLARMKSEFVANVSHEIRTPMSAILGMTELLLLSPRIPAGEKEHLGIVRDSTGALLGILNKVLDFSKLEAGRLELEAVPFAPRELLQGAVQLMTASAEAKGLALRLSVDPGLPELLVGDAGRLRQVAINLIANALKFTEKGEVAVLASRAGGEGEDGRVLLRFEVADTGIGISEEALGRLFRPFTQADASTTRRFGGSGLGLAISRQLIELMGGSLEVKSSPGKGSSFYFTVALRRPREGEAAAPEARRLEAPAAELPVPQPPRELSPLKILLVDDDPVIRKVALLQLETLGYEVDSVVDGRQAVEASARESYDLILMDCQMPVLDGFGAVGEIRAREGGRRHTPVIAMTARATEADRQKCLHAGMDDHVTKPLSLEALSGVLQRWDTPLDSFTLAGLRKSLGPAFPQVLAVFREDAAERLKALRAAAETGNLGELADQAHGLKGACGQVGARRMGAVCARLERAVNQGGGEIVMELLWKLIRESRRMEEDLAKENTA